MEALKAHKTNILTRPNVVGVGIGFKEVKGKRTGRLGVTALVSEKVPEVRLTPEQIVPKHAGRVPTDVVAVGHIRSLRSRASRWRPAPGGVSLGHFRVTAGTLGCVVRDADTGRRLILSNNHVLAYSNEAREGDVILQPGLVDGGRFSRRRSPIARLQRFYPLEFELQQLRHASNAERLAGPAPTLTRTAVPRPIRPLHQHPPINQVDAAVARPIRNSLVMDRILGIGKVAGTAAAALGVKVRKSGRSTGLTAGEITVLDVTLDVDYGSGRIGRFENQIVTTAMAQAGDSGSLLVASDRPRAVGLLFAGSAQVTVYNPIQVVLDALRVTL